MKERLKNYFKPFLNIKFLVSFGIAWMITNGWAYIVVVVSQIQNFRVLKILRNIALSYLAIIWNPFSPEKLVTIPIAIFIHTRLFKNDAKTLILFDNMYKQAKADWNKVKSKFKRKKKNKK